MGVEFGIRYGLPDHAPVIGLLRGDLIGEKGRAHRLGHAHLARQRIGAARVRDQANAGESLHEIRAFAGKDDIGGQRDIRPRPRRRTVHGGDGRHGAVDDGAQQRGIFFAQSFLQISDAACPVGQVLPRAKGPARPCQDHDPRRVPAFGHRMGQLRPHLGGQRIHLVGAVQRDQRDIIGQRIGNRFIVHLAILDCLAAAYQSKLSLPVQRRVSGREYRAGGLLPRARVGPRSGFCCAHGHADRPPRALRPAKASAAPHPTAANWPPWPAG